MNLVLTYDSSNPPPAAAIAALNYVVKLYDQLFTNNVTINIDVGWGEANGTTLASNVDGTALAYYNGYTYSSVVAALKAETGTDQKQADSTIPTTQPSGSSTIDLTTANAIALGLLADPSNGGTGPLVGYVGFGTGVTYDYQTGAKTSVPSGEYDFVALAEHEIAHVMGRLDLGASDLLSLFNFSAPGVYNTTTSGTAGYFSIDGGKTDLADYNNVSPGDTDDWASSVTADSFDAFDSIGTVNKLSTSDVTLMNALGWNTTTTDVTTLSAYSTVCFYPGTLVAVPGGATTVENLAAGDLVLTADGEAQPILWLGRQTVATKFADPVRVLPIRIAAGALDHNLPLRDLLVSPDHALLIDDVLVHAGALVNGTTITRETAVPGIFTYYHVELANHALILAEDVAAETFIDNVDRMRFDNWAEHEALYGDHYRLVEMPYSRAKSARQVPLAIRERLAARAAAQSTKVSIAA